VLGARTNRYGDFLDIACAIAGRAPDYGLHRPENRVASLVIDVGGLSEVLRRSDVFYPVLGTFLGRTAGSTVAVIDGLQGCTTEDRLKALGAAAASAGGVGLFHVAGVTPEAPDLATALGHEPPRERILLTPEQGPGDARPALDGRRNRQDRRRRDRLAASLAGRDRRAGKADRRAPARPPALRQYRPPCPSRRWRRRVAARRSSRPASPSSSTPASSSPPILPEIEDAVLMTNSGKFAHYAPGNTGYAVTYGSLAECVESAVAGRLVREPRAWS
jgi:hypothetical protein